MLDEEVYTIDTFTSYENRDEVRIKTYIKIKYRSEGIVTRVTFNGLKITTTYGHFMGRVLRGLIPAETG
jgi:hypothetical protein